jgi:hypothetical protein
MSFQTAITAATHMLPVFLGNEMHQTPKKHRSEWIHGLQCSEQNKHERQWKRQNDGPNSKSEFCYKFYNCLI